MILFLELLRLLALLQQFEDFLLEVINISLELVNIVFDVLDLNEDLRFALLSLESLSHTVGNRTFVKRLVSLNGHFDFITDSNEQKASFCAVDSDLPYNFIKSLRVQLLSDWANACLTSLALL